MSKIEILVLNGPPGSGKSTLATTISNELRKLNQAHAVIDLDELARLYPETNRDFMWQNLALVWPNYTALGDIKVVLPVLIEDEKCLNSLKAAAPSETVTVCELSAATSLLKDRVTDREPDEYWQGRLRSQVDDYMVRQPAFSDLKINTEIYSIDEAAKTILVQIGWLR